MVPGRPRIVSATAARRGPGFQAQPEAQGGGHALHGAVAAHGGELGQGHAGPIDPGADPHISRPGQGSQGLALMRRKQKQGLELHQNVQ